MSNVFANMEIYPLSKPAGTLVANGSVEIGGLVKVRFTVIKGEKGVFASLPARKGNKPDSNGKIPWYPDIKILNEDLYTEFQTMVKKEFAKRLGAGKAAPKAKTGEENQTYGSDEPF